MEIKSLNQLTPFQKQHIQPEPKNLKVKSVKKSTEQQMIDFVNVNQIGQQSILFQKNLSTIQQKINSKEYIILHSTNTLKLLLHKVRNAFLFLTTEETGKDEVVYAFHEHILSKYQVDIILLEFTYRINDVFQLLGIWPIDLIEQHNQLLFVLTTRALSNPSQYSIETLIDYNHFIQNKILNLNHGLLKQFNLSDILFNGSLIYLNDNVHKHVYLLAFRAMQIKNSYLYEDFPNSIDNPLYPWLWVAQTKTRAKGQSNWLNNENYIGLVLLESKNDTFSICSDLIKLRKNYNDLNNFLQVQAAGPEDPRLYRKDDGKLHMLFNTALLRFVSETKGGKVFPKQFISMIEINIESHLKTLKNSMKRNNFTSIDMWIKKDESLCEGSELWSLQNTSIKNFAYSNIQNNNFYLDSFVDYLTYYKPIGGNKCAETALPLACFPKTYQYNTLMTFFSNELISLPHSVHIALTTPEIQFDRKFFIGVAHVRIHIEDLYANLDKLNKPFQKYVSLLISRSQNKQVPLHNIMYLMLIYTRKQCGSISSVSLPFYPLKSSYEYNPQTNKLDSLLNYQDTLFTDIVFPCGITQTEDPEKIIITYGEGDCLLNFIKINPYHFLYPVENNVLSFNNKKLQISYEHLSVFEFNSSQIEQEKDTYRKIDSISQTIESEMKAKEPISQN